MFQINVKLTVKIMFTKRGKGDLFNNNANNNGKIWCLV